MKTVLLEVMPEQKGKKHYILSKRFLSACWDQIEVKKITIPVFYVPSGVMQSEKKLIKIVRYLKEERVKTVFLSETICKNSFLSAFFYKHFSYFTGEKVINYKIYEILRKYICDLGKTPEECTLILETDSAEKAKEVILKVYKHVKKIQIKTRYPEVFSALTEEFLDEYGLFIDVFREESKKEETVLVQLDSLCEEKGCLHLSADFEKSATIFFRLNEKGKKIGSVFPITQQALEFLIFMQFGHVSEETIRLFCKEYSTKIDKIRK